MTADDLDDDDDEVTPERWSWVWLAGCTINFAGNLGRLVTSLSDELALKIACHDAWRAGQRDFEDCVRRDLEAMPEAAKSE